MLRYHSIQKFTNTISFAFTKKKQSTIWIKEHVNDPFVKKAQTLNYRSRAAFKLIEIQHRFNIIKPGQKVIDLGSAPGSWTQVAIEMTKSKQSDPSVLGVDLLEVPAIKGSEFIQGDITQKKTKLQIQKFFKMNQVDSIICDAAPNFIGDKDCDHIGIAELNDATIQIAQMILKVGGNLVMKTLQGTLEKQFFDQYKMYFKNFQRMKPTSSRSRSSEFYYIGRGFKLSSSYQSLHQLEQCLQKNQKIPQDLLQDLQIDPQSMQKQIVQSYQFAQAFDDQSQINLVKQMANLLNIQLHEKKIPKIDKEQVEKQFEEQIQGKFSFTKKIPQSIEEFEKVCEMIKNESKNENQDQGLLENDEEYMPLMNGNKEQDFDEMQSFSDSDLDQTVRLYKEVLQQNEMSDELYEQEVEKMEKEEYQQQKQDFDNMTQDQLKSKLSLKTQQFKEIIEENLGYNRDSISEHMENLGYNSENYDKYDFVPNSQSQQDIEKEMDEIERLANKKLQQKKNRNFNNQNKVGKIHNPQDY